MIRRSLPFHVEKLVMVFFALSLFLDAGAVKKHSVESLNNQNIVLTEAIEYHITNSAGAMVNSTVTLNNEDAWIIFDNLRPSEALAYKSSIYIQDAAFEPGVNGRIAIFAHGTAIMPHKSSFTPLQAYTETNFGGNTQAMQIETYHNALGTFDNSIRSFKLKRGYMATFANNANGTGYSRVFVADTADINLPTLPKELDRKISFIRIFKHEWVTKKGWCGTGGGAKNDAEKTKATWYYSWSADQVGTNNLEYAVIKQNGGWPGWTEINNKKNVTQLLGYNEPDRPDQANLVFDYAISQWPEFLKSGLRLGSPATSDPFNTWSLFKFVDKCKELNYRVDFVAIHAYWAKTPQKWYDDLKYIHERTGLPIWITEWNNGANWTTEWWPSDWAAQQTKQLNDLKVILNVLDTAHFVERYSIYNWVTDKRAIILNGNLTPAGEYYANNQSKAAFNSVNEAIPTWNSVAPTLSMLHVPLTNEMFLSWSGGNGELSQKTVVERRSDISNFEEIFSTTDGTISNYSDALTENLTGNIRYRIRSIALNGSSSASNEVAFYMTTKGSIIQAGNFNLADANWQTCIFPSTFAQTPEIILGPTSYTNKIPMTNRVRSLTNAKLNFHIEPWLYLNNPMFTGNENVSLLAMLPGHHDLGGLEAEAGNVSGVKDAWIPVTFSKSFLQVPVVFCTQVTISSTYPTTVRVRNVSTTGFEVCLQKEQIQNVTFFGDKISYVAVVPGQGYVDGKRITVALTENNAVGDYYLHKELEYPSNYTKPAIYANLQTANDSYTSTLRYYMNASTQRPRVFKHRETSLGSMPVAKDQLGYMVIDLSPNQPVSNRPVTIKKTFSLYPSPVTDFLYIDSNDASHLEIFSLSGKKIRGETIRNKCDVSSLPKGVYMVRINGISSGKIIKEN